MAFLRRCLQKYVIGESPADVAARAAADLRVLLAPRHEHIAAVIIEPLVQGAAWQCTTRPTCVPFGRRHRRVVEWPCTPRGRVSNDGHDERPMLAFCSNDYLGLASHPAVVAALAVGAHRWGAGSGASQLIPMVYS
jgi:hypothetical protein